ncbi:1-acyl-sn-glycerol-3-phosphate acyltransferase [Anseongella ginsenosidimutans]|uniref:1-acyl-sn-glycerol-3-phosphate acyltransferase n=1 Tax=Anseongella ginsenosidimutans TaxID=496056 RepID=A0A4R3KNF4_9SPHI|nr:lysophospholipid acyltransferase family protein [Anseongella ginsenosidimutans]QEC52753.1 1-acyl-sn-glycerol-3-phosphate acyltransferase [Anseongella ginsenosidimutans]TCS85510.1 1-acyl-sn-glycerol-3-phosphate acyltransferase [Anseongella ginsenosidimutans]
MKGFPAKLHAVWLQFILLLVYAVHYPFFLFFSRQPRYFRMLNICRRNCSAAFMNLSGIFFDIRYEEPLDRKATFVFCPNHTSYLDIPLMCLVANGAFYFMGKEELLRNPLFRLFFKTIDVPVNRDSKLSGYRAIRRASGNLKNGMSLVLFPEGTISEHPPQMLPFKNGAFRLAIENKVPVVPVSMLNTWDILYDKGQEKGSRPGIIRIFVHKPVPTAGLDLCDEEKLRDEVSGIMRAKLSEYASKQKHR